MALGVIVEPALVLALLFGGTIINRNRRLRGEDSGESQEEHHMIRSEHVLPDSIEKASDREGLFDVRNGSHSQTRRLPSFSSSRSFCRLRRLSFFDLSTSLQRRDTSIFRDRLASRILRRYPFLIEVWYWIIIYWVYQLGRAFTAVTILEGTVHVARRHALQLIRIEKRLNIFWEQPIQEAFIAHPLLLRWVNRIYSYVHIPASVFFLAWLYYKTTTCNRAGPESLNGWSAGPILYETRRRTMAVSNLLAFVVFTVWPCMPPRLLSDKEVAGSVGSEARSYGFVDTVHGEYGESSVWTQNRFCNQYAAMPSLHFGYALLIGVTIATIPLNRQSRRRIALISPLGIHLRFPSMARLVCISVGVAYSVIILMVILATANHFVLDAVAGALVCALGWLGNEVLTSLLPLENLLLWCLRIHKPEKYVVESLVSGVVTCLREDSPRLSSC